MGDEEEDEMKKLMIAELEKQMVAVEESKASDKAKARRIEALRAEMKDVMARY
jgi:hypothetical protein